MYALRTRTPLVSGIATLLPFDLHVLGLPLAFILSQDQTLRSKRVDSFYSKRKIIWLFTCGISILLTYISKNLITLTIECFCVWIIFRFISNWTIWNDCFFQKRMQIYVFIFRISKFNLNFFWRCLNVGFRVKKNIFFRKGWQRYI